MRALAAGFAAALALAAPAEAAFENLGAGARAPGMGGAFTSLADDAYAPFYNPAGLSQLERPQAGFSYSKLYLGLSDGSDLSSSHAVYAHPLSRGRQGTLAVSWARFGLSGLYDENVVSASYGRKAFTLDDGSTLMAGLNLKYMSRSFSRAPEADNACAGLLCAGGADPVLSGATSRSALGADLGVLWRFPRRFQAGLAIDNVNEPNVGFGGADKLPRAYRAGLAYRSLWMSLVSELRLLPAQGGGPADREFVLGAEKFYPTLDYGQFGVRAALGAGSREYREINMGASYRIDKIQVDYAFTLPVGAIKGHSGTHRFGLLFHFGAPTSDEELSQDLLERARRARDEGVAPYAYGRGELPRVGLDDPAMAAVRDLVEARRYRAAKEALANAVKDATMRASVAKMSKRLDLSAQFYPDLSESYESSAVAIAGAVSKLVAGEDAAAMSFFSHALDLARGDAMLSRFVEEAEALTGLKAERLPAGHPRSYVDELLHRGEHAYANGDFSLADRRLQEALALDPSRATTLSRLGSLRYVQGRLPEAAKYWERALPLETREDQIRALREYIQRAKGGARELPSGVPAARPQAVSPVAPAAPARPAAPADPRRIAELYQKGVEAYAHGEHLQAIAWFLRILELDPSNEQARKALARIGRAGGGKP